MSFTLRRKITAALEAFWQEAGCRSAWYSELPYYESLLDSINFSCGFTVNLPVSKEVFYFVFQVITGPNFHNLGSCHTRATS